MAKACLPEGASEAERSEGKALGPSRGFIARVPNQEPQFVPAPPCLQLCSPSQVAEHVRRAVCLALLGDDGEEPDEEDIELTKERELSFRVLFRERDLEDAAAAAAFLGALAAGQLCVVRVLFRLLGGKGGFGSLLRGQKGRGKKTTNMDAMRDLSGRRLRHSKAVERIKKWMEDQRREDDLVAALTAEGPELPKPTPKAEILDPEYVRKLKQGAAAKPKLVVQGMRRLQAEAGGGSGAAAAAAESDDGAQEAKQHPRQEGSSEGGVRARHYFGAMSALEGLSSGSDSDEQDGAAASAGAASSSCAAAASST